MQIHREALDKHTIRAYGDGCITINQITYATSLIVSRETLITPWPIQSVQAMTQDLLEPMLALKPEVIIIGHQEEDVQIPLYWVSYLANLRIGVECMSIGSASRTFNVLLSEQRNVVLGVILS